MQSGSTPHKTIMATPNNPVQPTNIAAINTISGFLVILLPVVVVCTIGGYRKHKTRVLQQRINQLNRIWQIDSSQKLA